MSVQADSDNLKIYTRILDCKLLIDLYYSIAMDMDWN